jgi:hypothetical protein
MSQVVKPITQMVRTVGRGRIEDSRREFNRSLTALPLMLAGCATAEQAPTAERPWHHVAGGFRNRLLSGAIAEIATATGLPGGLG